MGLQIAKARFDALATLLVQSLGLRRLHALPQRVDFLFMLRALDRSSLVGRLRAFRRAVTRLAMLRRTAVLIDQHLLILFAFFRFAADLQQGMPLGAVVGFLRGMPTKLLLAQVLGLGRAALGAVARSPVVHRRVERDSVLLAIGQIGRRGIDPIYQDLRRHVSQLGRQAL